MDNVRTNKNNDRGNKYKINIQKHCFKTEKTAGNCIKINFPKFIQHYLTFQCRKLIRYRGINYYLVKQCYAYSSVDIEKKVWDK